MEIHQLLVVAAYGDATTNEALRLRGVFRELGPSHVFSCYAPDPRLKGVLEMRDYAQMESARAGTNLLLVHFAMGHQELIDFVMDRPEPLLMRYHNVTPPALFADFDATFAAQLTDSRRQLAALKDRVRLAIAASSYSARDLQDLGYRATAVVPLLMDLEGLVATRPRPPTFPLPARPGPPVVMFTGRISPNKRFEDLLQAFHVLKTYLRPNAHLVLSGSHHHVGYLLSLQRFQQELRLRDVVMPGHLSNAELVALYRRADVFLCLSEHEGFGAPLAEAMAFDVPVVARAAAAIPETVGQAAVLLPDGSPALAAEAVHRVLEDAELRRRLVAAGRRRVADLEPAGLARRFQDLVKGQAA